MSTEESLLKKLTLLFPLENLVFAQQRAGSSMQMFSITLTHVLVAVNNHA